MLDEGFQGFAAIERGSKQPPERYIGPSHLEDVAPAHQVGSGFHLLERDPGGPGSPDERSDAGTHHETGDQASLLQGPEYPDMGQALETTAAQNQGEGAIGYHRLPGEGLNAAHGPGSVCKNRAL